MTDGTLIAIWAVPVVTLAALMSTAGFLMIRDAVRDFRRMGGDDD